MYTFSQPGYLHLCIFLAASGDRWSLGWYATAAAVVMDNTGAWTTAAAAVPCSRCAGDAAAVIVVATAATVPTAVRPPTVTVVLVLALLVPAVQVLAVLTGLTVAPDAAAGATVTFSRPAVVVAAADVAGVDAVAAEATRPDAPVVEAVAAAFAAAATAAAEDSSDATTVGDTSVSSGGLGGGVANPDQHVEGELLLDVTLLAQSRPTSTSTRVDHVVSHGDSDRVGEDDTIGSSFRYRSIS